jgi:excisionase family DNA binding protein
MRHNGGVTPPPEQDDGADIEIEPRFFTLEQTARYLNVSKPQVYALVRSGELPAIKLGGRGCGVSTAVSSRPTSSVLLRRPPRGPRLTLSAKVRAT